MSSEISDSDLELIKLGKSLGLNLVSFSKLRESQENKFADEVRSQALEKMEKNKDNLLIRSDSFYAGSIDFMISEEPEGKKYFLLETNGGSHRGISILTKKQQSMLFDGYLIAINQAIKRKKNEKKIFVLIGITVDDRLIHEKVIMIEYFRKKLKTNGYSVKIFNTGNYDKDYKAEIVFLIADYGHLSKNLSFHENWIKYKGEEVNVVIGDGIVRRFNDIDFTKLIKNNFREIKSIIVNPIFKITDDKSLTYLMSFLNKFSLKKYNLKFPIFTRAFNEKDLEEKLKYLIKKFKKTLIIKPSGGSGGAGVIPIYSGEKDRNIKILVEKSKKEFFSKFIENRDPFPYTIQEMCDFSLIDWQGGKRTFDLRIYLAQREGKVVPVGGLARIAREEIINKKNPKKEEFVVNLSGYNDLIEVDRGLGFSFENCRLLKLLKVGFIDMFCIGCTFFANIEKYYEKVINYSEWENLFTMK
ncbi:MAG: hypothetical protein ACFFEY_09430 [Candidatus Thorarchaeota archaeon]